MASRKQRALRDQQARLHDEMENARRAQPDYKPFAWIREAARLCAQNAHGTQQPGIEKPAHKKYLQY
jgi:hypothetical protein